MPVPRHSIRRCRLRRPLAARRPRATSPPMPPPHSRRSGAAPSRLRSAGRGPTSRVSNPSTRPTPPHLLPPCVDRVADLVGQAFDCPAADAVVWDADTLVPDLHRRFGSTGVTVALAHEVGHAVQTPTRDRRGAVPGTAAIPGDPAGDDGRLLRGCRLRAAGPPGRERSRHRRPCHRRRAAGARGVPRPARCRTGRRQRARQCVRPGLGVPGRLPGWGRPLRGDDHGGPGVHPAQVRLGGRSGPGR